jgi:hypothetical protein
MLHPGCSTYCIDESLIAVPCIQCSACLVSSRPQPKPEVQHKFCQLQLLASSSTQALVLTNQPWCKLILASPGTHKLQLLASSSSQALVLTNQHQGSQAHPRVEILGPQAPFFGNLERVFDRLIEILAQNEGVFRPVLPENLGSPHQNGSIGAPHRNWPMPIDQLVEIPGGSLRALVSTQGTLVSSPIHRLNRCTPERVALELQTAAGK